jgi:hypothetical protein
VSRRRAARLLRQAGLPPPALPLWPTVSNNPWQPKTPNQGNLTRTLTSPELEKKVGGDEDEDEENSCEEDLQITHVRT